MSTRNCDVSINFATHRCRSPSRAPAWGRHHAGVGANYPPPPWRLTGRLLIAMAPLRLEAARGLVPAPLRLLPAWPGHALAMLLLGSYDERSTLPHNELAAIVGPVLARARPGGLVTAIWVDDERSAAGGRELWGLPKQLATLQWRPEAVEVQDAAGAPIAHARWHQPPVHVPIAAAAPFITVLDGAMRRGWLAGTMQLAPARIELEIPPGSPLAPLALGGRRIGLTGRLDARALAARVIA